MKSNFKTLVAFLLIFGPFVVLSFGNEVHARPASKLQKKIAAHSRPKSKPAAKRKLSSIAKAQRPLKKKGPAKALSAAVPPRAMASGAAPFDPNRAIEVRGQTRTLSMMLVLKNGKDSINFIKVRKDYQPEILATEF